MRLSAASSLVYLLSLVITERSLGFLVSSKTRRRTSFSVTDGYERKPGGQGFGKQDKTEDSDEEKRKANLFQVLLRDLQIEGVPLLGVDATQVHTLQAALWTTLAELCENPLEQKACLVFEYIPVSALQPFVDDFMILKTQVDKTQYLPEIGRVSLSMVGKGIGPAILIDVVNATSQHHAPDTTSQASDDQCTTAMKAFMNRLVIGQNACPHVSADDSAPSNLAGTTPKMIAYRTCRNADVFHILSRFWNSVCELYASTEVGTILLMLPGVGSNPNNSAQDNHARFANVAELMSRYLCLYKGDGVFELLHFYPEYERDWITPRDRPGHGHLPPTGWLRAILRQNGDTEAANQLSEQDLQCSNYQRRSPMSAVCIKRVEFLEKATDEKSGVVQLSLDDGSLVLASGVPTYARNTIRLANVGGEALQREVDQERSILS